MRQLIVLHGFSYTLGILFVGVLMLRALLFEVPDFRKLPYEPWSKLLTCGLSRDDVVYLYSRAQSKGGTRGVLTTALLRPLLGGNCC